MYCRIPILPSPMEFSKRMSLQDIIFSSAGSPRGLRGVASRFDEGGYSWTPPDGLYVTARFEVKLGIYPILHEYVKCWNDYLLIYLWMQISSVV